MWFRRDLRTTDHRALAEAAAAGPVVGVFVVDPVFDHAGSVRRSALGAALDQLDAALGGHLVIRHGRPEVVIPAVAAECHAADVFVSRDAAPYGRRRDALVAEALRSDGRRLRGVGWNYAVAPGSVVSGAGHPYRVFTPFARAWRAALEDAQPAETTAAAWRTLPSREHRLNSRHHVWVAAEERWQEFVDSGSLDDYAGRRNHPGVDGTSRMSAALRWGTAHPRQLIADLDPEHTTFLNELAWREFHADVLLRSPQTVSEPLDVRFSAMPVDTDAAARARFERWRQGLTGFPLVDAGMRQLARTGWMHNRVRMIVGSFLVKDLHLPWQWGAKHFLDQLVDGDLASNTHNWQWVAGCGTDAAPYFRVFNPTAQSERFDPDGAYIRTWVSELRDLGDGAIHQPGRQRPDGYPEPMVDHATERAEALARYRATVAGRRPPITDP